VTALHSGARRRKENTQGTYYFSLDELEIILFHGCSIPGTPHHQSITTPKAKISVSQVCPHVAAIVGAAYGPHKIISCNPSKVRRAMNRKAFRAVDCEQFVFRNVQPEPETINDRLGKELRLKEQG